MRWHLQAPWINSKLRISIKPAAKDYLSDINKNYDSWKYPYSKKPENTHYNIFWLTAHFSLYDCYCLAGVFFVCLFWVCLFVLFCFKAGYITCPGVVTCGIAAWELLLVAWEDKRGLLQHIHSEAFIDIKRKPLRWQILPVSRAANEAVIVIAVTRRINHVLLCRCKCLFLFFFSLVQSGFGVYIKPFTKGSSFIWTPK